MHDFVAERGEGEAPLLDLQNVSASYRTLQNVIDDVSLQIRKS